ncbi:MAG: hypothetical protein IJX67_01570 [Oscillospiraceae bacterium]|nr:hypothetical protein [Oscillospiraceae bacterium]
MKLNVKPEGSKSQNLLLIVLAVVAVLSVVFCALTMTTDLFVPAKEYASLVLYEGPKPISASTAVSMKVDGHELFVYDTEVNNTYASVSNHLPTLDTVPITSFDFDGAPVTMQITVNDQTELTDVVVRPLAKGIVPTVEGNVITFQIPDPDTYTVEYNGSALNAVHIFANAIDPNAPTESTDTVKYIGPGAWNISTIKLTDGMELYISGGAVIRGVILGNGVSDVKISGSGFLDGSHHESWMIINTPYVPVSLSNCENMDISGIALLDSNAWCFNIYDCDNINVDNVKMISARPNGDGVTIQSSRDIHVSNCFVRTWDDSLVVKNYSSKEGHDSANITFDGIQVWTDLAQSMEIGYETNKGDKENTTIQNITFQNITVLHNFHKPVMSIHNSDGCAVSNIRYSNIIVEDASLGNGDALFDSYLIDINTLSSAAWSTTKYRGTIDDVVFDGIYVLDGDDSADSVEGNFCHMRVYGESAKAMCTNITVNNLFILGEAITDENVMDIPNTVIGKYTENVHFTNDSELPAEIAAITAQKD